MELIWTDQELAHVRRKHGEAVAAAVEAQLEETAEQLAWVDSQTGALHRMKRRFTEFAGEKYLNVQGKDYRVIYLILDEAVVFYTVIEKRARRQNTVIESLKANRSRVLQDARRIVDAHATATADTEDTVPRDT